MLGRMVFRAIKASNVYSCRIKIVTSAPKVQLRCNSSSRPPRNQPKTFLDGDGDVNRDEETQWDVKVEEDTDKEMEHFVNSPERVFEELTVEKYESLIKSEEDRQLIEEIIGDYDYAKYTSSRVPVTITVGKMEKMMKQKTLHERMKYFNYLFVTEFRISNQKRRQRRIGLLHEIKIMQRKTYPVGQVFDENNRPIYRKWHNSLFMHVKEKDLQNVNNYRKMHAAMFGRKLVLDCGFEEHMNDRELLNLVSQFTNGYGVNQEKKNPFDLYLCNYPKTRTQFVEYLEKGLPNVHFPESFISLETRSYLELFPKEKIIYLSPNSRNVLNKVNHDEILVIGGIVDLRQNLPLTFAKAKREGIRMARLPLDEHLAWGHSKKTLPINHIMSLLNDVTENGFDWKTALINNISSRKLKSPEVLQEEQSLRFKKMFKRKKNFFKIQDDDYL